MLASKTFLGQKYGENWAHLSATDRHIVACAGSIQGFETSAETMTPTKRGRGDTKRPDPDGIGPE